MELTGLGSGVLLALAAALWLVYLVPSWLRRSEYLATERNALRLQQTLRVLAETAEVPIAVRAETSARSVAAQQRSLREQQQVTDAVARAQAAAAARAHARQLTQSQPGLAAVVASRTLAARRLRRTRGVTSLILLSSIITLAVQVVLMVATGVAPGAPAVLAFAGVGAASSFLMLGRLAAASRARARAYARPEPATRRRTSFDAAPAPVQQKAWTPVPVPKPLYLSRPVAERPAFEHARTVADLEAAAAASESALRAAHAAPEVTPISRPDAAPAEPRTPNRFAAMGLVDASETAPPNLDEVLRRRRAAG